MSSRTKKVLAGVGVAAVAVGAFALLSNRDGGPLDIFGPEKCPLTGLEPADESRLDRPAVAVKIENNPVAYPLSGLERADVVYEELVEGGMTRFLAIYHCNDVRKAGPIRSSRVVDAAIMSPYTRILGAAGGNRTVRDSLEDDGIVLIDENAAGSAMRRVERPGISSEHTLYASTPGVRRIGTKEFDELPRDDIFEFGDLDGRSRRARSVTLGFGGAGSVSFRWSDGAWLRFDSDEPTMNEAGEQLRAHNVIVELHTINLSEVTDVRGTPSTEIADVTGSGRALLFRDGRRIVGRWTRESEDDPVVFKRNDGDVMVLAPGTVWIELVPNQRGEVKGSVSYAR